MDGIIESLKSESKNPNQKALLDDKNYSSGFLIDDQWMAGITSDGDTGHNPYSAFVLNHLTGEYVAYQTYSTLKEALQFINQIPRSWVFESTKGCGTALCEEGKCKGEGCKRFTRCHPEGHESRTV